MNIDSHKFGVNSLEMTQRWMNSTAVFTLCHKVSLSSELLSAEVKVILLFGSAASQYPVVYFLLHVQKRLKGQIKADSLFFM